MFLARSAVAGVVTLLLVTAGLSQTIPSTGIVVPGMASYDQLATSLMTTYQIPGAAIAIARNGRLVFARGYGYANTSTGELVRPDSLFRIASLTKPITSAAILLLVQRGEISLDQRVFDILKSEQPLPGQTPDPRLASITVRELLEHQGGWNRDSTFDPMFIPLEIAAAAGTPPPPDTRTIIRFMMGKPLQFDPGTAYNYSNYGYALLGRVIETISGQTYEAFVRGQVLSASGACMSLGHSLQSQSLPGEVKYYDYPGAPLTSSVYGQGQVPWPDGGFYLEAMDSHGGWVASPVDYLRFVLSVDGRDHPQILSSSTISTMVAQPSISVGSPYWYGLGWLVRPSNGDANWWHTGSLPGSSTIVVRNYNGMVWVAFFNSRPADQATFFNDLDSGMWTALAGVTSWPSDDQFPSFSTCHPAKARSRAVRH